MGSYELIRTKENMMTDTSQQKSYKWPMNKWKTMFNLSIDTAISMKSGEDGKNDYINYLLLLKKLPPNLAA